MDSVSGFGGYYFFPSITSSSAAESNRYPEAAHMPVGWNRVLAVDQSPYLPLSLP